MSIEITIIMSAYNASSFVEDCIKSIINQTFKNYEFIIVDDASTDNTYQKISRFTDSRIKLFRNASNKGLTANLNFCVALAKGKYIARIDSDDICLPNRLQTQYEFLEENTGISVVGSNAYLIDMDNCIVGITDEAIHDKEIKTKMLITNPIIHPSTMIRKIDLLRFNYDENFMVCQDYDLWVRMSNANRKFSNIKDPLILYRLNYSGTTRKAKCNVKERISLLSTIVDLSLRGNEVILDVDKIVKIISITLNYHHENSNEECYEAYCTIRNRDLDKYCSMILLRFFKIELLRKAEFRIFIYGVFHYCRYVFRIIKARLNLNYIRKYILKR